MFQIIPTLTRDDTLWPGTTSETYRSWYHEQVVGSDQLLITVGDSWTWGDALGGIFFEHPGSPRNVNDDYDHRNAHVYGALLARRLGTDFLNMARCGCANSWMYEQLAFYLPELVKKYKKITVVVTMTEIGRDSMSRYWVGPTADMTSFYSFLETIERATFQQFKQVFDQYPEVEFLLGRNFTFTFPTNYQYCQQHLPKTWVELIEDQQSIGTYPKNLRIMSDMAIGPIRRIVLEHGLENKFKEQMLTEFGVAEQAISWLESSSLNSRWATKHPNEAAHKLWANYLYSMIANK